MSIRKISRWFLGILFSLFCLGEAGAVAIGPNLPAGLSTSYPFRPAIGGWCVAIDCDPNGLDPYVITADPEAGVWIKALRIPGSTPVPSGTVGLVLELLQVGDGPAWQDWHERIINPGWEWLQATLLTGSFDDGLGSFGAAPGLEVSFSLGGLAVSFDFDPLLPGTDILVAKQIRCRNETGCSPAAIVIAEYPSIPEPATPALLGIALAGLAFSRRRRLH